ncbi:MAG: hypothetical protein R2746_06800 [Acidimicrobiales bacterium]
MAYVSSNGVVNFVDLDSSSANTAIPNPAAPNERHLRVLGPPQARRLLGGAGRHLRQPRTVAT